MNDKIERLKELKYKAVEEQDFELAVEVHDEQRKLEKLLERRRKKLKRILK